MAKRKVNKKSKIINKNYGYWEVAHVKWATFTITLFLLGVWPWLRNILLDKVHWAIWLVLGVLFMIRPLKRFFS